ncbi:MAG: hypothetical protein K0R18_1287 [Bacillales bacterium]|jgi:hypothetical protein|nr:hypothetical protein [Bacillales bacterium]
MHDTIESYCVTQAIFGRDASFFKKGGKDYAAFKLDSIMFTKQAVILSNEWFLLHVQDRFVRKITSQLIKAGVPKEDISTQEESYGTKIYVIQHPDKLIPYLMKFEEQLNKQKKPPN